MLYVIGYNQGADEAPSFVGIITFQSFRTDNLLYFADCFYRAYFHAVTASDAMRVIN